MRVANTLRRAAGLALFFIFAPLSQPAARQVLPGHVPAAVAASQPAGRMPAGTKIQLAMGLPLRNQQQLEALLQRITDPASPEYRHYLTPAEFAERFGPSEEDYQTLEAYVQANGFRAGKGKRRDVVLRGRVHVRPGLEQQIRDFQVVPLRGPVQRGKPVRLGRVHVCMQREQRTHVFDVAALNCFDQAHIRSLQRRHSQ